MHMYVPVCTFTNPGGWCPMFRHRIVTMCNETYILQINIRLSVTGCQLSFLYYVGERLHDVELHECQLDPLTSPGRKTNPNHISILNHSTLGHVVSPQLKLVSRRKIQTT